MDESLTTIEEEVDTTDITPDNYNNVKMTTSYHGNNISRLPVRTSMSRIPKKTYSPVVSPSVTPSLPLTTQTLRRSRNQPKSTSIKYVQRSQSVPAEVTRPVYSQPPSTPSPVKKVPMNRIVVGMAPSSNLSCSSSRVGSLTNKNHRPGGGQVKIENRKLEWNVAPRTQAINRGYSPGGGEVKIEQRKLEWNGQSKVGSLDKVDHKPGGGQVRIENRKLDWKKTAKVGSTNNMNHKPGGGNVKIHDVKPEFHKVSSRINSLSNVNHKAGGGDVKIFDDIEYRRQSGELVRSTSSLELEKDKMNSQPFYQSQVVRKLSPMGSGLL